MKCAVQIYMVLAGFHLYKSVFLGWVVDRFNIEVNGEHNCGVPPKYSFEVKVRLDLDIYPEVISQCLFVSRGKVFGFFLFQNTSFISCLIDRS